MNANWWSRALGPEVIIPALITLVFGVLAIWYARRGPVPRERQRDFATSVRRLEIFSQPVFRESEFQCLFRGEAVRQVAEYRFVFANTGHEPILKEDYDEAVALQLHGDSAMYDYRTGVCRPADLKLDVNFDQERKLIVVAPMLLNPGDFASFNFIATNRPEILRVGRIRGVRSFGLLAGGTYEWFSTFFPIAVFLIGLLMGSMVWWIPLLPHPESADIARRNVPVLMKIMMTTLGLAVAFGGLYLQRSWASLREARYLGRGTEAVFVLADNKSV